MQSPRFLNPIRTKRLDRTQSPATLPPSAELLCFSSPRHHLTFEYLHEFHTKRPQKGRGDRDIYSMDTITSWSQGAKGRTRRYNNTCPHRRKHFYDSTLKTLGKVTPLFRCTLGCPNTQRIHAACFPPTKHRYAQHAISPPTQSQSVSHPLLSLLPFPSPTGCQSTSVTISR